MGQADQVKVKDQFLDAAHGIEEFHFEDTTIWTEADIVPLLVTNGTHYTGTSGDDYLLGTHLDDTLEGATGNDTVEGAGGSDTYVFNLGDGQDIVVNTSTGHVDDIDALAFGVGITSSDVAFSLNGTDLIIDIVSSPGDQITVQEFIGRGEIDRLEFADGAVLSSLDVRNILAPNTTGNDNITGTTGNDVLFGNAGDDTLSGSSGSDTYFFAAGKDRMISMIGAPLQLQMCWSLAVRFRWKISLLHAPMWITMMSP